MFRIAVASNDVGVILDNGVPEKFKNITRSSVSVGSVDESTDMNQKSIDDILKDLGL